MKKFDPAKPFQTRAGFPARLLTADLKTKTEGGNTIVAAVEESPGEEVAWMFASGGEVSRGVETCYDLVNILPAKQLRTRWAVVYPEDQLYYRTEAEARADIQPNAIAVVPIQIEFVEGQGL